MLHVMVWAAYEGLVSFAVLLGTTATEDYVHGLCRYQKLAGEP